MIENKIAFIIYNTDKQKMQILLNSIRQLVMPPGMMVEAVAAVGRNRVAAYNKGMKHSDAKYKIYLDLSARFWQRNLLIDLLNSFMRNPGAGMLGLLGSWLPSDAKLKGIHGYGGYKKIIGRKEQTTLFHNPIFDQSVQALDGSFIATCQDIPWDESSGAFFALAQCCRFRAQGYEIVVPQQNQLWMSFACSSLYIEEPQTPDYEAERRHFLDVYATQCFPLVSILIPTYNQPEFFRVALESALQQDYRNLEIIVGDDSTDTRTKELIQPYLAQHDNIHYYHHGGPLGGKGIENIKFVLNHCSGTYVNYLLHDDLFYPHKISRMMNCFLADAQQQIVFVSSARDAVDEHGRSLGYVDAWCPFHDELVPAHQLGSRILYSLQNFVGELTTVLFRKESVRLPFDKEKFSVGYFQNVEDIAHGDVSTWLELCSGGGTVAFLAEHLSAVRKHSGQNTFDSYIMLKSVLEWCGYVTLAWLHHLYIGSESEYQQICRNWAAFALHRVFHYAKFSCPEDLQSDYELCASMVEAVQAGEYERVLHLSITYMLGGIPDAERLLSLCQKNAAGYWCRKEGEHL